MNGKPSKYKAGDVLKYYSTRFEKIESGIVLLIERYDILPNDPTSWKVKEYPNGKSTYIVLDSELSPLN